MISRVSRTAAVLPQQHQGHHGDLEHIDHCALINWLRHTKNNRQRLQSQRPIAFHALEVVDHSNAEARRL